MSPGNPDRQYLSDRELLIRIDERQENMLTRLDSHSQRLQSLERARLIVTGAGAVVLFGIYTARDVAVEWFRRKIGGRT